MGVKNLQNIVNVVYECSMVRYALFHMKSLVMIYKLLYFTKHETVYYTVFEGNFSGLFQCYPT